MKVHTTRFGEIEVRDEDRLTLVGGLLGFYGLCDFAAYRPEGLGIFCWLQSLDIPQLAFVMCPADVIAPGYRVGVSKEELMCIGLADTTDADVFVILTHPAEPERMTANLLGPIVVNRVTRQGRQVVLYETDYSSRHVVFPHLCTGEACEAKVRQECA